jgi:hypothetical protein
MLFNADIYAWRCMSLHAYYQTELGRQVSRSVGQQLLKLGLLVVILERPRNRNRHVKVTVWPMCSPHSAAVQPDAADLRMRLWPLAQRGDEG